MRFQKSQDAQPVHPQMSSMIDMVFQLLIFFLLTLKILAPEGDFNINMPRTGEPTATASVDSSLKVTLQSNADGTLREVWFGQRSLGGDTPQCFERLNDQVTAIAGGHQGFSDDLEVEIASDYDLQYRYIIKAMSACKGRMEQGTIIPLIEKVKLSPTSPSQSG